jgi:hypothetical protein
VHSPTNFNPPFNITRASICFWARDLASRDFYVG